MPSGARYATYIKAGQWIQTINPPKGYLNLDTLIATAVPATPNELDALLYPVENAYTNLPTMYGDQANQTVNYFQYVISEDKYYEYLGTTNGDLTDYRELTPEETIVLTGKNRQPVTPYATLDAMLSDQKKQIEGFIYYDPNTGEHYEYKGTQNTTLSDYREIGPGFMGQGQLEHAITGAAFKTGTNTSVVAEQLVNTSGGFDVGLNPWAFVVNTTTGARAVVTEVISATAIRLSHDIFQNTGESYEIYARGFRIRHRNEAYYGQLGANAVDLSVHFSASSTHGALGSYSFAAGASPQALGAYDFVFGGGTTVATGGYANAVFYTNTVTTPHNFSYFNFTCGTGNTVADYCSAVFGLDNTLIGSNNGSGYGFLAGRNNSITGYANTAFGAGILVTGNSYCTVVGHGNVDINEDAQGSTAVQRRLFVVGNGTLNSSAQRTGPSDAFRVWRNGEIAAPSCTNAKIDAFGDGDILITRDYLEEKATRKVKISLTATNINNIGTTPITAIAAPGAGQVINIISAFANLTYGTIAFDNNTLDLETSGAGGTLFTWSSFLDSTANNLKTADRTASSDNDLITNTAVVLTGTDSVATGDSTVDVYITYEIITL